MMSEKNCETKSVVKNNNCPGQFNTSFCSCFVDDLGMKSMAINVVPKLLNFHKIQRGIDMAQKLQNAVNNF